MSTSDDYKLFLDITVRAPDGHFIAECDVDLPFAPYEGLGIGIHDVIYKIHEIVYWLESGTFRASAHEPALSGQFSADSVAEKIARYRRAGFTVDERDVVVTSNAHSQC